jgi:hypothetical protein
VTIPVVEIDMTDDAPIPLPQLISLVWGRLMREKRTRRAGSAAGRGRSRLHLCNSCVSTLNETFAANHS